MGEPSTPESAWRPFEVSRETVERARRAEFADLIDRSSVGGAHADIKARGIDAHLVDLEQDMRSRR